MTVVITLVAYLAVLLGIGLWAGRRTHDSADFHLAGRRLGPRVAALSASASSSSAWTLLGVSGAAYLWGLQAVWLIPAIVSGFAINWFLVAPRLQRASHDNGAVTLVEFLAHGSDPATMKVLRAFGALIILFCFTFYVASQLQAAGTAIGSAVDGIDDTPALILGAAVVVVYVLVGGFWAASVTDALQGLLMLGVSLVLPVFALVAVGGFGDLAAGLRALEEPGLMAVVDQPGLILAGLFVAGLFGIGLGYPGQPHVVNRFMALEKPESLRTARNVALGWAVLTYCGMVLLGLCGRVLLPELADHESVLLELSLMLLPVVVGGLVTGGVLAAVMSTVDSQLLVAGSAVSHDLQQRGRSLRLDRIVIALIGIAAVLLAMYFPASIFQRVLFAWQGLGNAFGPLLLVMLWAGPVAPKYRLAAMIVGFGLTVTLSFLPSAPGDAAERLIPFMLALVIAWAGRRPA